MSNPSSSTTSSSSEAYPLVESIIELHYLVLAPVILFQFFLSCILNGILSQNLYFVKSFSSYAGSIKSLESWYQVTVWSLVLLTPLLEASKGLFLVKNIQRPPIFNSYVKAVIRNHFILNGILVLFQFSNLFKVNPFILY